MKYNNETLTFLSDDGNGHRLWWSPLTGGIANEAYDPETGESFGLDDDVEGWNCTQGDVIEGI